MRAGLIGRGEEIVCFVRKRGPFGTNPLNMIERRYDCTTCGTTMVQSEVGGGEYMAQDPEGNYYCHDHKGDFPEADYE